MKENVLVELGRCLGWEAEWYPSFRSTLRALQQGLRCFQLTTMRIQARHLSVRLTEPRAGKAKLSGRGSTTDPGLTLTRKLRFQPDISDPWVTLCLAGKLEGERSTASAQAAEGLCPSASSPLSCLGRSLEPPESHTLFKVSLFGPDRARRSAGAA